MAENKTKPTSESVTDFLNSVKEEEKRKDSFVILEMIKKASGEEPKMWGSSLIGFGDVHITSASGREVDWFRIGFAPRKANFSLYLSFNIKEHADLLSKLGKHKTGMGCLYINKLADVDMKVLKDLVNTSLKKQQKKK
jgi:hypothetical protein